MNVARAKYFLREELFLSLTQRHCIVLDVNRDRYLCLDRRDLDRLAPWLHGWQSERVQTIDELMDPPSDCLLLASELVTQGILSESPQGAKTVRPARLTTPRSALSPVPDLTPGEQLLHAVAFFLACATAHIRLRTRSFKSTIQVVDRRRRRNRLQMSAHDFEKMSRLVATFNSLRLLYPHPRASMCLFDSLSLIEFLAHYQLFPSWVFGVQAEPFLAHCWIQENDVVVNDTIERVSLFVPIMQV